MIISDLNYLEVVTEEVFGGTGTLVKNVKLSTAVNQSYKVNIKIDSKKDFDSDIDSKVDLKGNVAITTFENTAFGKDTYVQSDVSNTAKAGVFSESAGTLTAAAYGK